MSSPNAIPIGGLTAEDIAGLSNEVLRALMNVDAIRAQQIINSIPRRFVAGAPYRIINPGLPQFDINGTAFAAAFR